MASTVRWRLRQIYFIRLFPLSLSTMQNYSRRHSVFLDYFSEKIRLGISCESSARLTTVSTEIRLDISCESSARQTIHMKCRALFESLKKKSSAAVVINNWSVMHVFVEVNWCIRSAPFNLYHSLGIFCRRQIDDSFLIFPRKQDLTFHTNCLLRRQFARNVQSCFLRKIRKVFQNVVCWKFYPKC